MAYPTRPDEIAAFQEDLAKLQTLDPDLVSALYDPGCYTMRSQRLNLSALCRILRLSPKEARLRLDKLRDDFDSP